MPIIVQQTGGGFSATGKLSLYNGALRELGERSLASLTENREPRRLLDGVWDNNLVRYVLGQGQWRFARRTKELYAEPALTPDFGYRKAFAKPVDFVRTVSMSSDERGNTPLTQYAEEAGYWFSDCEPIYATYVSDDASYGGDFSQWGDDFTLYVEVYLASRIANRVTQDKTELERLRKLAKTLLTDAKSGDAMEGPTVFPPTGRWVQARLGGRGSGRNDRGNTGGLTG